jgi:mevalonate kinase
MPLIFGKAPGKIILFGEHAVVYGQPAIAIPVTKVKATARVYPEIDRKAGWIGIQASDINLRASLADLPKDHPLSTAIKLTLDELKLDHIPALTIQISSTIPIGGGMGSSAAVSIAIMRGLSAFLGRPLSDETISDLAYEVEKFHHGTPSGIDNTVIAFQAPIFFQRGRPNALLKISKPTHWVIADTGEMTPTRETVADVRAAYIAKPEQIADIFEKIGIIAQKGRTALEFGEVATLGGLMNENQRLLKALDVSNQKIEALIEVALHAGAAGAKLSGGGRGGNIIALAQADNQELIGTSLKEAGATRVITTMLSESEAH